MLTHVTRLALLVLVLVTMVSTAVAQAPASALLVSPEQLARELNDADLIVLHVGPRDGYDAGHIAGARFVELRDVSTPRREGALSLELPDDATLQRRLEALGIGDRSRVVVAFGDDWVSPATRVVFTLHAAGLADRTRFLNGGTPGWRRAGLPVTTQVPGPAAPGRLTSAVERALVVDHEWVQANAGASGVRLIDARAPMFFEGPRMHDHEVGHIRGAANIPFNSLFDDSLRVLPTDELRRRFAAAGVRPGDTVTAYCHIGQQATVVLFAARLLGHPVKLYDGSMDDWEKRGLPLHNPTRDRRATPPEGNP